MDYELCNTLRYVEKTYFLPSAGLLIFKYLDNMGELKEIARKDVSDFYLKADTNYNYDRLYMDIVKEPIQLYFGTKYVDDYTFEQDLVNKVALNKFARFLISHTLSVLDEYCIGALLHLFNELDRNVRNHSALSYGKDKNAFFYSCANIYGGRYIQFAVADAGQGFYESLKGYNNPVIESVKMGVTAGSNHGFTGLYGQNSGYGLYLMNELSKKNHNFEIVTNCEYYSSFKDCGLAYKKGQVVDSRLKGINLVSVTIDLEEIAFDITEIDGRNNIKSNKSNIKCVSIEELRSLVCA